MVCAITVLLTACRWRWDERRARRAPNAANVGSLRMGLMKNNKPSRPSLSRIFVAPCVALALGGCGSSNDSSPSNPSNGGGTPQTYSLISTISGLSSSGLTLAFNNSTVSVASGATSVILASALASGTAYTVNVQAQPTGETCSVASGAGTIAAANVANVVVTCSDQAYTLGGTLSGLNGSGLILANGADTLPISSGVTTFAMPAQVAYTASYDVTVKTQPAGLACSVSHGQGTMPASAVSDVAVSCTDQPFSVSGTISGLGNYTGLVLVNGSDTLTVSAGATSFTMPAQVPFASNYNVVVQSSPTGLTCSVANGNGTMGTANVTNVAVTCSDQSYILGGTITGFTQSNLVLANGSDTISVSSGTSTFAMPTQVAYTSSYNVHVVVQPRGLTCSVSNGIGMMPAGTVANVAVNCSVNTYTIGGAISGLTATGLVLLNNGGDATPIAANAIQFTMHTGVVLGGTYAITAQTQPTDQTCTINNAGGSPVFADVWSIAIACAPWTYTISVLHTFGAFGDGVGPNAGLIQASDGNFYGTTAFNGANNNGTVFKITPTGVETVLHTFGASGDGVSPDAGLIQASDGNFYGTTYLGGANNSGTVFRITPAGLETVLYSFGGDGANPNAGITQASDGNFYGTTRGGGANGAGTVFEMVVHN
jgi:uncharacterized repeat protein (TIGR03803 family)